MDMEAQEQNPAGQGQTLGVKLWRKVEKGEIMELSDEDLHYLSENGYDKKLKELGVEVSD